MLNEEEANTASSTADVSIHSEEDAPESNSASVDRAEVAPPLSNGGSNSSGSRVASMVRVNTVPLEILNSEKLEAPSGLERSKTDKHLPNAEKQRRSNILAEEAAQIFDDRISVQQKLKLLNRIATVKDDGTVEFEVPGDVEPQTLGVGSGKTFSEVDDEPLDDSDLQDIPPMQIVMLIVGTRGDVQPFVAIGKKLQIMDIVLDWLLILISKSSY